MVDNKFSRFLDFLYEKSIPDKQEELLKEKFRKLSRTKIGKEIGVQESSKIEDISLTSYSLYHKYYDNPVQEAFMYPLKRYLRVMTSGTMGTSKWYLLPERWIVEDQSPLLMALIIASSHDGSKITFEKGDTVFAYFPPKPFMTGTVWEYLLRDYSHLFRGIPEDQNIPYQEKMVLLLKNYEDIDVAFLAIPQLMYQIHPWIRRPIRLKGLITANGSIEALREKIRELTTANPSTTYGSTETGFAAIPSAEYPMGFILDWRNIYCEFIPEERAIIKGEGKVEPVKTVLLDEVRIGEKYQLVVTPFKSEITRYFMPDILECVGLGDNLLGTNLPVFKFFSRVGGDISLHNFTRIDEKELLTVLKEANIPYIEFTARAEAYEAREYLAIYLETTEEISLDKSIEALHQKLCELDRDYAALSQLYQYIPLKLKLLPKGTFVQYLHERTGIPKPERIGMKEEHFQKLLAIGRELARKDRND